MQSLIKILSILLFLGTIQPVPASTSRYFNVQDYGAVGDAMTLNTLSIQQAIDKCAAAGGGTVLVPAGQFLTGTLILRDNINLHLEAGAVLLGSTELKDYPEKTPTFRSYTDVNYVSRSLIYAEKLNNIAITGNGTIDGQGEEAAFQLGTGTEQFKKRPFLLRLIECKNVKVLNVSLINAAGWVQHYLACEDVTIDGIRVHSMVNDNNDGLDIDCSNRVRVSNSSFTTRDDAIVLKSTAPKPCENITITNCNISSYHYGFKCGTESTGGFSNIIFSNSVIHNTRRAGIALELVDGGVMDGVIVSNIIMEAEGGLFVRLGNRARPYLSKGAATSSEQRTHNAQDSIAVGEMRNIIIENIIGKNIGEIGCSITGIPGQNIENLTLSNIMMSFQGGGTAELVNREVPEQQEKYPEVQMFGVLPAYGLYSRHIKNLKLDNVSFQLLSKDARPGFVFENINGLILTNISADGKADEEAVILKNVKKKQ